MVYEPWNASKKNPKPFDLDLGNFLDSFSIDLQGKPILAIKETSTRLDYIRAIDNLLSGVKEPIKSNLIWIIRNPFHVYLSEVSARKDWWGEDKLEHTSEVFEGWARKNHHCYFIAFVSCQKIQWHLHFI
ncbi:hypothetical protein [Neosynechococcus sphagnicola]|uniref:hypothetical protein n=1 Tax=Neosynechococcus sphagnicola TaxID=1501145 RepID=UPI0012E02341|nr:hypothetical protein [Neosynechococcus sphagnicola]